MFYQTKLRSVNGSGATDVNGKHLRFIGFNPAQAGDTVWTDGKVIFGHVPCRSTPLLPAEGGIPCAFDDVSANGYFKKSGKYQKYKIAVDEGKTSHIVNGKKLYFHFNTPCFDAEIAVDEKGNETGLLTAELDGINGGNNGFYFVKDNEVLDDDCVVIKKDGVEIERVYLRDYADAIDKATDIASRGSAFEKNVTGHSQLLNFHLNQDGSWDALIASFAYGVATYQTYRYHYGGSGEVIKTNGGGAGHMEMGHRAIILNQGNPGKELKNTMDELGGNVPSFAAELVESADSDNLQEAIANLYKFFSEPYFILVEWWDHGEISSINTPSIKTNYSRRIFAHYLVHVKSNGYKEIIHEDLQADAINAIEDTGISIQEVGEWSPGKDCFTLGKKTKVSLMTVFQVPLEEETDDQTRYCIAETIQKSVFQDNAIYIKKYNDSWRYPAQDNYSIEMNEWKILKVFDPHGKIICQLPIPRPYPGRLLRITAETKPTDKPPQGPYQYYDFQYLYTTKNLVQKGGFRAFKFRPTLGMYDTGNPTAIEPVGNHYKPLGELYGNYPWDYVLGDVLLYLIAARFPSLSIVPLKEDYLIGFASGDLYRFNVTKNELNIVGVGLHNFRLRYLKNILKAKK